MNLYKTHQFNIAEGEQYRITGGTRTLFVYRNKRGVHVSLGGYVNGKNAKGAKPRKKIHWRKRRAAMDKYLQG